MLNVVSHQTNTAPQFGMARVVIGEDQIDYQNHWEKVLNQAEIDDYKIVNTTDKALAAIEDDTKLLITDYDYQDGKPRGVLDVIRTAKERNIPIILQTAERNRDKLMEAYYAGAYNIFSKHELDGKKELAKVLELLGFLPHKSS